MMTIQCLDNEKQLRYPIAQYILLLIALDPRYKL